jgi:hypothetical protein
VDENVGERKIFVHSPQYQWQHEPQTNIAPITAAKIRAASKHRFCSLVIFTSVLLPPLLVYSPDHYAGAHPLLF